MLLTSLLLSLGISKYRHVILFHSGLILGRVFGLHEYLLAGLLLNLLVKFLPVPYFIAALHHSIGLEEYQHSSRGAFRHLKNGTTQVIENTLVVTVLVAEIEYAFLFTCS